MSENWQDRIDQKSEIDLILPMFSENQASNSLNLNQLNLLTSANPTELTSNQNIKDLENQNLDKINSALKLCLGTLYSDQIQEQIDLDNIVLVLTIANFLQLEYLKSVAIQEILINNLDTCNVIEFYNLALTCYLPQVANVCIKFLSSNIINLEAKMTTFDFNKLLLNLDSTLLKKILKPKNLIINKTGGEYNIYSLLKSWLYFKIFYYFDLNFSRFNNFDSRSCLSPSVTSTGDESRGQNTSFSINLENNSVIPPQNNLKFDQNELSEISFIDDSTIRCAWAL